MFILFLYKIREYLNLRGLEKMISIVKLFEQPDKIRIKRTKERKPGKAVNRPNNPPVDANTKSMATGSKGGFAIGGFSMS